MMSKKSNKRINLDLAAKAGSMYIDTFDVAAANDQFFAKNGGTCYHLLNHIKRKGYYTSKRGNFSKLKRFLLEDNFDLCVSCTKQKLRRNFDPIGFATSGVSEFQRTPEWPDFLQTFAQFFATEKNFALILRVALLYQLVNNLESVKTIIEKPAGQEWCHGITSPRHLDHLILSLVTYKVTEGELYGDDRLADICNWTDLHLILLSRQVEGTINFVGDIGDVYTRTIAYDDSKNCDSNRFYVQRYPDGRFSAYIPNSINALYPGEFILERKFLKQSSLNQYFDRYRKYFYKREIKGKIIGERIEDLITPSEIESPFKLNQPRYQQTKLLKPAETAVTDSVPSSVDILQTLSFLDFTIQPTHEEVLGGTGKRSIEELVNENAFRNRDTFIAQFDLSRKELGDQCVDFLRLRPRHFSPRNCLTHVTECFEELGHHGYYEAILALFDLKRVESLLRFALLTVIFNHMSELDGLLEAGAFNRNNSTMSLVQYAELIAINTRMVPDFIVFVTSITFQLPVVRINYFTVGRKMVSLVNTYDPELIRDSVPIIIKEVNPGDGIQESGYTALSLRYGSSFEQDFYIEPVFMIKERTTGRYSHEITTRPIPGFDTYEASTPRPKTTTITRVEVLDESCSSNSPTDTEAFQSELIWSSSNNASPTASLGINGSPDPYESPDSEVNASPDRESEHIIAKSVSPEIPMIEQRALTDVVNSEQRSIPVQAESHECQLSCHSESLIAFDKTPSLVGSVPEPVVVSTSKLTGSRVTRSTSYASSEVNEERQIAIWEPSLPLALEIEVEFDENNIDESVEWEVYSIVDHDDSRVEELGYYFGRRYLVEFMQIDPISNERWRWYCIESQLDHCLGLLVRYRLWLKRKERSKEGDKFTENPPTTDSWTSRKLRSSTRNVQSSLVCHTGVFSDLVTKAFHDIESINRYSDRYGFYEYYDSDGRFRHPLVSAVRLFRGFHAEIQNMGLYKSSNYKLCGRVIGSFGSKGNKIVDKYLRSSLSDADRRNFRSFKFSYRQLARELRRNSEVGKKSMFILATPHAQLIGPSHCGLLIRLSEKSLLVLWPETEYNYDYRGNIEKHFRTAFKNSTVLVHFGNQTSTLDCFRRIMIALAALLDGMSLDDLLSKISDTLKI